MDDYAKFQNIAIRFLSYRPRSEKEVREKLHKKKAPQDILEQVVTFLKKQKFLNDEEFVKWWITKRTEFKPMSLRIIKLELKQKGISQDVIESVLEQKDKDQTSISDLNMAKAIVARRIDKYKGLSEYKLVQKLGPYLARRGFNYDTIKEAIDEVKREDV